MQYEMRAPNFARKRFGIAYISKFSVREALGRHFGDE
jgi:hypothetical protein